MRDWKARRKIAVQEAAIAAQEAASEKLDSEAVKKGTTTVPDLAAGADAAAIVTKVNALLAALRANGTIKS